MKKTIALIILCALLLTSGVSFADESWTCAYDGSVNSRNFCPVCGRSREEAGGLLCPSCGAVNVDGSTFCEDCGSPQSADAAPAEETAEAPAPVSAECMPLTAEWSSQQEMLSCIPEVASFDIGDTTVSFTFSSAFPAVKDVAMYYYDANGDMQSVRLSETEPFDRLTFSGLPSDWEKDDYLSLSLTYFGWTDGLAWVLNTVSGATVVDYLSVDFHHYKYDDPGVITSDLCLQTDDDENPVYPLISYNENGLRSYWVNMYDENGKQSAQITVMDGEFCDVSLYENGRYEGLHSPTYNPLDDFTPYTAYTAAHPFMLINDPGAAAAAGAAGTDAGNSTGNSAESSARDTSSALLAALTAASSAAPEAPAEETAAAPAPVSGGCMPLTAEWSSQQEMLSCIPKVTSVDTGDTSVTFTFSSAFPAVKDVSIFYYDANGDMQSARLSETEPFDRLTFSDLPSDRDKDGYMSLSVTYYGRTDGLSWVLNTTQGATAVDYLGVDYNHSRYADPGVMTSKLCLQTDDDENPVYPLISYEEDVLRSYWVGMYDENGRQSAKITVMGGEFYDVSLYENGRYEGLHSPTYKPLDDFTPYTSYVETHPFMLINDPGAVEASKGSGSASETAASTGSRDHLPAYAYGEYPAALSKGSSGNDVKTMQQALIDLGYLDGGADGQFGPKSKSAVEAFQRNNGIHSEYDDSYGVATGCTLAALYSTDAVPAGAGPRSCGTGTEEKDLKLKDVSFTVNDGDFTLDLKLLNDSGKPLTAISVLYCLVDSSKHLINDVDVCYCVPVKAVANGSLYTPSVPISVSAKDAAKVSRIVFIISEAVFEDGEVLITYDASKVFYNQPAYSADL